MAAGPSYSLEDWISFHETDLLPATKIVGIELSRAGRPLHAHEVMQRCVINGVEVDDAAENLHHAGIGGRDPDDFIAFHQGSPWWKMLDRHGGKDSAAAERLREQLKRANAELDAAREELAQLEAVADTLRAEVNAAKSLIVATPAKKKAPRKKAANG